MGAPKVSIVLATFNRWHLLKRSLMTYAAQGFRDFELVIVDDWSYDETEAQVRDWSSGMNIVYLRPPYKLPDVWRDTSSIINLGLRAARGEVVLMTHPEVMIGQQTLSAIYDHRKDGVYQCTKCYYLTADNQRYLDDVAWETDLLKVRELPSFYESDPEILGPSKDYSHRLTDQHTHWESWIFGGHTRTTWRASGPMTEFTSWGSVDMDWLARRSCLGLVTQTELDPATFVVHQNHDHGHGVFRPTNRDMDAAMRPLKVYHSKEEAFNGPIW